MEVIEKLIKMPLFQNIENIEYYLNILKIPSTNKENILKSHNIIKKHILYGTITDKEHQFLIDVSKIIFDNEIQKNYNSNHLEIKNNYPKQQDVSNTSEIDINSVKNNLVGYIAKIYLLKTPIYNLMIHYLNFNQNISQISTKENFDYLELAEEMLKASDKDLLEKIVLKDEESFINYYLNTIRGTENDLKKIFKTNQKLFNVNLSDIEIKLQNMFSKYRMQLLNKIYELYAQANKFHTYCLNNQETSSNLVQKIIKGSSIGMMSASLLGGPIGMIAAMGATYMINVDETDKKQQILKKYYEDWAKVYDKLFLEIIPEYYEYLKKVMNSLSNYSVELVIKIFNNLEFNGKQLIYNYLINEIKTIQQNEELQESIEEAIELEAILKKG